MATPEDLVPLEGGGRTRVHRRGSVVIRDAGPWTPAVHVLLRHLEYVGFDAAPRLVGSGFGPDGRETLTFIEGEFTEPGPWSLDGAAALGSMLRSLHQATSSFRPPPDTAWFPWHGRDLGDRVKVIGHCDVAPWNIVARDGLPVALIDWETAGPVDPLIELAQMVWLNAKLHDDIVAELEGLPPLAERARQAAAIVDAYGLTARQRRGFFDRVVEFVIIDAAWSWRRRGLRYVVVVSSGQAPSTEGITGDNKTSGVLGNLTASEPEYAELVWVLIALVIPDVEQTVGSGGDLADAFEDAKDGGAPGTTVVGLASQVQERHAVHPPRVDQAVPAKLGKALLDLRDLDRVDEVKWGA